MAKSNSLAVDLALALEELLREWQTRQAATVSPSQLEKEMEMLILVNLLDNGHAELVQERIQTAHNERAEELIQMEQDSARHFRELCLRK